MFKRRRPEQHAPISITKVVEADIANAETQLENLWAHTAPNLARYDKEPPPPMGDKIVNYEGFLRRLAGAYLRLQSAGSYDDSTLLAPETRFAAQRMVATIKHDIERLDAEGTRLPPNGLHDIFLHATRDDDITYANTMDSYQYEARRAVNDSSNTPSGIIVTAGIQRTPPSNDHGKKR